MACSNAKYTQFVVNGLKRVKLPMWFSSVGTLISPPGVIQCRSVLRKEHGSNMSVNDN